MSEETSQDEAPEKEIARPALAIGVPPLDLGKLRVRLVFQNPTFVRGYLSALVEWEILSEAESRQLADTLISRDVQLDGKKAMLKDALDTLAFFED